MLYEVITAALCDGVVVVEAPSGSGALITVEAAVERGVERVAVIDWDVHHGNGTQSGFYERSDVLTISMHMPLGSWNRNNFV